MKSCNALPRVISLGPWSSEAAAGIQGPSEITLGCVKKGDPDPTHSPCHPACHPSDHCFPTKLSPDIGHAIIQTLHFPPTFPHPSNHPFPGWFKTHHLEESHTQSFLPLAVPWVPTADHAIETMAQLPVTDFGL